MGRTGWRDYISIHAIYAHVGYYTAQMKRDSVGIFLVNEFYVGQRWISDTEVSLGLGIVETVDHRLVTIFFPAVDQARSYAKLEAPLTRIIVRVGETLETIEREKWVVHEIREIDELIFYFATPLREGSIETDSEPDLADDSDAEWVPETTLHCQIQIQEAHKRLFAGQLDNHRWFQLRYEAWSHRHRQERQLVNGLAGARTSLLPHQLYIAEQVNLHAVPRALLSDEVGLGKTIEAGLIIHQRLFNEQAKRVLIITPQALMHQWFVEMLRRFNLHFHIFDQSRIESLLPELEPEENPYHSEQLVLCNLDFLMTQDWQDIVDGNWDMVVVDEAHHLVWTEESPSEEYLLVEAISRRNEGLILLTATPEQLGKESHYARLRLLDHDRFYSYSAFLEDEKHYQPIAEAALSLIDNGKLSDDEAESIKPFLTPHEIEQLDQLQDEDIGVRFLQGLLDRHGTSRIMYRNTRKNVKGFPDRKVNSYPLPLPEQYANVQKMDLEIQLNPEVSVSGDEWCLKDTRVSWLSSFISGHRSEKILVICAKKETAIELEVYLRYRKGARTAVFHEDMDIISRDRAAAYFAESEEEDGAQLLICSEIGSEGRNFQFAHNLVLFDLPLNPDLLEQRIGRLDRIGQTSMINIHVPWFEDTAQSVLFHWYHEGLNAFEQVGNTGGQIYKELQTELHEAMAISHKDEVLVAHTRERHQQLQQELESGRNKLLEISSYNEEIALKLVEQIEDHDPYELADFMDSAFDAYGVDSEEHSKNILIIQPGDHMATGSFPALPEDGIMATFDRATALARDDIQFISWEHPMVTGVMDMLLSEYKGNASTALIKNKAIKPGTILLEAVFVLESQAPAQLQIQRFMPTTCIRVLLDPKGRDIGTNITHDKLNLLCDKLPKAIARKAIKQSEDVLENLMKTASKMVRQQTDEVIQSALEAMQVEQKSELERLEELKVINPAIKQEELDYVKYQTHHLQQCIESSRSRLDALRIIFAA